MAATKEYYVIEVSKFENYHPRSDYKTMPWFKLSSSWHLDPKVRSLTPIATLYWPVILGLLAECSSSTTVIDASYLRYDLGVKGVKSSSIFSELEQNQLLTIHLRTSSVQEAYSRLDKIREDKIRTSVSSFPFSSLYDAYPRKSAGKKQGMEWLEKNCQDEKVFNKIMNAIINYKLSCEAEKTEERFIKTFDNYLKEERWKDQKPYSPEAPQRARTDLEPEALTTEEWFKKNVPESEYKK